MGGRRRGGFFFRWMKSDLPDREENSSPVLLLAVHNKSGYTVPERCDACTSPRRSERHNILSQLNERFRKTLSLDSRVNRSVQTTSEQTQRPKSMVNAAGNLELNNCSTDNCCTPKKKRFRPKSFFTLETFLDSRRSEASSDDFSSSKYCKFYLDSSTECSPVLKGRTTPDLLDVPAIADTVSEESRCKKRLDKLENHYNRIQKLKNARQIPLNSAPVLKDYAQIEEEAIYTEPLYDSPIGSKTESQNPDCVECNANAIRRGFERDKFLNGDRADSSFIPVGSERNRCNYNVQYEVTSSSDADCSRFKDCTNGVRKSRKICCKEGTPSSAYEINITEDDVLVNDRTKNLVVKVMDKSVDSIGSCSLDVDADNTDFSDTTSGSLNILTPSSTTSHYRDFASKFQERATPGLRQDLRGLPLKEEAYLKPYPQDPSNQSKPCFGGVPPPKKPSYLHLACSINGYSNLTTYDSTLRQKLSRSRENSPARPGNISSFVMLRNRTDDAMAQRLNANPSSNGGNSASPFFKTSFSETSISSQNVMTYLKSNGQSVGSETHTSKSYHVISNGSAADESPSKSFIQQRVERLYGPGALAQGFFNQKKQLKEGEHNTSNGASSVTQISHTTRHVVIKKTQNGVTSENTFTENYSNGQEDGDAVLPVMRHLRAEFRAQLPVLSPKRSPLAKISDNSNIISNNQIDMRLSGLDVVDRSTISVSKPGDRLLSDAKVTIIPIAKSESIERNDTLSSNGLKTRQFSDIPMNGSKNVEAVVEEIIPVVTSNASAQVEIDLLPKSIIDDSVVQDGPYFLNLKRIETEKLLKLGDAAELCLVEVQDVADVSEEVKGFLRAAAGKARLLASQKMQQFEGLCHNNINGRPEDQFPTTNEDLRGFWDMVCLQIEDIRTIFEQINIMKGTNWKEVPVVKRTSDIASKSASSTRSRLAKPKKSSANQTEAASAAKASAAKKRDEQRKALLEAKRRAVKADCDSSVEIFAPPPPGANTDVAKESS